MTLLRYARLWPALALWVLPAAAAAAVDPFAEVDAAPVKTSIYIGSVTLKASPFRHEGERFVAQYTAKVFPFFFASESGRMSIAVPPADLGRIAAGLPIRFRGEATRTDGTRRELEGTAEPTGSKAGRLVVKIHVSRRITLSFVTTYIVPGLHPVVH